MGIATDPSTRGSDGPPRGYREHRHPGFARVGVGYGGGEEPQAALELAASIALAEGGELRVEAIVDDRLPPTWSAGLTGNAALLPEWEQALSEEMRKARTEAQAAAEQTGAHVTATVARGKPADTLLELSKTVDLMVIGSRRLGPVARLLLGSTGEALLHDAACRVLVVPRPPA